MVLTCGEDDGIDGRVVVDRGDILLPFKQYVVEPIEFVIEAGRITDIRGDGYQAELVRTYIADFDDPDAYGLSHIGWGLDERAKWAALATDSRGHGMELRAFCGNVLFSTGPNDLVGGPNHTSCHLDIPMRGCSLYLDDRPIIVDGEVVVDAMRPAAPPRRLAASAPYRREREHEAAGDVPGADRGRRRVDLGAARLGVARSACGSGSPTGCRAARGCRRASPACAPAALGDRLRVRGEERRVYGCCGFAKTRSTGPVSTTRPRYMTATRSATFAITDSWWEMKIIVRPRRSVRSTSRSRICAWIETSRALTASSAISSSGCGARLRAIATRWRCPPRELAREAARELPAEPDQLEQLGRPSPARRPGRDARGRAAARRSPRRPSSAG